MTTLPAHVRHATLTTLAAFALALPTAADAQDSAPPPEAVAAFREGSARLAAKDYPAADALFRKAYNLGYYIGLFGLAEVQVAEGKQAQAIDMLETEAALQPNRLETRVTLANLYTRAGRYSDAIPEFQAVLKLLAPADRRRADIYLRIGETYRRQGAFDSAIDALHSSLAVLPDNLQVLSTLAMTLDGAGKKPEAAAAYARVIELDPNSGVCLNNLAYLLVAQDGDLDQALGYATRAHELMPDVDEPVDTIAVINLKQGHLDSAVDLLVPVLEHKPDNLTYRAHLLEALTRQGQGTPGAEAIKTTLSQAPTQENQDALRRVLASWPHAH